MFTRHVLFLGGPSKRTCLLLRLARSQNQYSSSIIVDRHRPLTPPPVDDDSGPGYIEMDVSGKMKLIVVLTVTFQTSLVCLAYEHDVTNHLFAESINILNSHPDWHPQVCN